MVTMSKSCDVATHHGLCTHRKKKNNPKKPNQVFLYSLYPTQIQSILMANIRHFIVLNGLL